jgi:GT2 family glycosyltransferase
LIVPKKGVIPAVILNWNGEEDTIECLKSVRASKLAGFVPVLVDNGSRPEGVERLKRECKLLFSRILFFEASELSSRQELAAMEQMAIFDGDCLVFVETGENLGFAKGNNVGIRFAELIDAEWVMLLNNDTVVEADTFQQLRKFLETHPSFKAVTPQIRFYNPRTRIQNCGGELTYFGTRKYRFANMDASALPESQFSVVSFVTGCALLFKYNATGALTEDFFFGEEDYEFSLRMKKRGLLMACVHDAVIYHKVGTTIAKASRPLGAILVHYVNRLINTRNYYSKVRWEATRLLAYLYLPVLLARNGINPTNSISAVRKIESYVKDQNKVTRTDFQALIVGNL